MGSRFIIISDHRALTFMLDTPYHNSRLVRWSLAISEFDFNVEHCKGKDNVVADYFSRVFHSQNFLEQKYRKFLGIVHETMSCNSESEFGQEFRMIAELRMDNELIRDLKNIKNFQLTDDFILQIKDNGKKGLNVLY